MNRPVPPFPAPELTARRVRLVPYEEGRYADIERLLTDPKILWWRAKPMDADEVRSVFERVMGEQRIGQGVWLMYERATGALLGQAMLKPLPSRMEWTEIGYHLTVEARGKGYATEAALRLLAYGFEDLALMEIHAVVLPHNLPSQAVMARLGMRRIGTHTHFDMPHDLFRLARDEWAARP